MRTRIGRMNVNGRNTHRYKVKDYFGCRKCKGKIKYWTPRNRFGNKILTVCEECEQSGVDLTKYEDSINQRVEFKKLKNIRLGGLLTHCKCEKGTWLKNRIEKFNKEKVFNKITGNLDTKKRQQDHVNVNKIKGNVYTQFMAEVAKEHFQDGCKSCDKLGRIPQVVLYETVIPSVKPVKPKNADQLPVPLERKSILIKRKRRKPNAEGGPSPPICQRCHCYPDEAEADDKCPHVWLR